MAKMERKIRVKTLNTHITCRICKGYLIDATTVTECLHTFCKSCLVNHLEDKNTCPQCETMIHQSHPLQYIAFDRTMQDIVYKLVPDLQKKELGREHDFYKRRNMPFPRQLPPNLQALLKGITAEVVHNGHDEENQSASNNTGDCHRSDEQLNLLLESDNHQMKHLGRKFLRVSAQATVTHLKKYLAKKLYNNMNRYKDVEVLCNKELLGKDHTLKFVSVTRWRHKEPPLRLGYRPKMEL